MRGSVQGFGPNASPPMQLTQGHSALKLCKIGELRHHVGWWEDRNEYSESTHKRLIEMPLINNLVCVPEPRKKSLGQREVFNRLMAISKPPMLTSSWIFKK